MCCSFLFFFLSLRSLYFFFYLRKDGPPFKKRCLYERQVILFSLFFHVIVLYSSVERIFFYFPSFFSSLINVKHVAAARALAVAYFLNGFISTSLERTPFTLLTHYTSWLQLWLIEIESLGSHRSSVCFFEFSSE